MAVLGKEKILYTRGMKLFLMRHGQSAWNQKNQFTGWVDIPLTQEGVDEAVRAGRFIAEEPVDVIYTSTLIRAHMTLVLAMNEHKSGKIPAFQHISGPASDQHANWSQVHSEAAKQELIPVYTAWELNERYYGKLQGLNKAETAKQYGAEQVQKWRRSFDVAPPEGESLKMTAERTIPYLQKEILPQLKKGRNVLVVAHGNSLRSIAMHLENMTPEEVLQFEIPTGETLSYSLKNGQWHRS